MINPVEAVLGVFGEFLEFMESKTVYSVSRILSSSFTRKRLISLKDLLLFLIFRKGKTLNEEISRFFQDRDSVPSKQAVIKRESLLNFDVWDELNFFLWEKLREYQLLERTYKGYTIIAIDGSLGSLPPSPALNQLFGGTLNQNCPDRAHLKTAQARFSAVYDVLNHFLISFLIAPYEKSEITLMMEQLDSLLTFLKGRKVIFVLDRYYASAEFFLWCRMHGFDYVVRAKKNFYKEERACLEQDDDGWFELKIDYAWSCRIKKKSIRHYAHHHPFLYIRQIRSDFSYRETEYFGDGSHHEKEIHVQGEFFTSLTDGFRPAQIVEYLYKELRWDLETAYDVLKNELELENVHSASPVALINMLYGKTIFFNLEMILYTLAQDNIGKEYIPNNRKVIEECHTYLFQKLFCEGNLDEKRIRKILREAARYKRKVQKNRHYRRWGRFFKGIPQKKFRIDGRANPKVARNRGGYITVSS